MAIVVVSVILAILGYAFVTGLAYKFVKEAAEEMEVFEVLEPPPPPEEVPPPPPPPDTPVPPPPTTVVVQKPIVQVPAPPPPLHPASGLRPAPAR